MSFEWKGVTERQGSMLQNADDRFDPKDGRLKIFVSPSNYGGCSYYRGHLPYLKLQEKHPDLVHVIFDMNPLKWDEHKSPDQPSTPSPNFELCDVFFTQNIHNWGGMYTLNCLKYAHDKGAITHYDNDDLLTDLYAGHRLEAVYKQNKLSELTKVLYNSVHIVSVTQRKFAERIREHVRGALVIIKNSIDFDLPMWNLDKVPAPKKKLVRIGWVGGIHHSVDVKEFAGVVSLVNQKLGGHNIAWQFYGRPPLHPGQPRDWQQDVWDEYEKYLLAGNKFKNCYFFNALPCETYGQFYQHFDIAIAPLQMNAFNDSKSEIKLAECGRYAIPLIASNVGCYDEWIVNGKTGYLIPPDNPKKEWINKLCKTIKDKQHREEMGTNLKAAVDTYFDINKVISGRLKMYLELIPKLRELQNGTSNDSN